MTSEFDISIIGAGIIGLAVGNHLLQRYPNKKIAIFEKDAGVAQQQTGRNSGVVHAGVYYQPGSLKAQFCQQGLKATKAFCKEHHIAYRQTGKLIVATDSLELNRLEQLSERCVNNGLNFSIVEQDELKSIEPNISGIKALKIESSAITDYPAICQQLANNFINKGGELLLNHQVHKIEETSQHIHIHSNKKSFTSKWLVSCSGLAADRMCKLFNIENDFRIIPFRGEYYALSEKLQNIVSHLIYPVPDPALPFLGIHLTPMINGQITVGPNAVLGWKREGYGAININVKDSFDNLSYAGFWRLATRYHKAGISELKSSLSKKHYLKAVQKYCPSIQLNDLQKYPTGVRAQAVNRQGELIHDFLFQESSRSLHVCNAPSPAATSAFPIASHICDKLAKKITT